MSKGFKVIQCAQGSPEWHAARAGVITASMFGVARSRVGELDERQAKYVALVRGGMAEKVATEAAGYKVKPSSDLIARALAGEKIGDWSEASKNYAFRLAIERISGVPMDEGFETWQMARGHELEPLAREEHQVLKGVFVETAGFVTTNDGVFGASADGLIGEDGGSEYKCLVSPERLRKVLLTGDWSEFKEQVMGCMWITRRDWWHLGFYCPQLANIGYPLHVVEIERDDDYIETMERDLLNFKFQVDAAESQLRNLSTARSAVYEIPEPLAA